MSAGHQYSGIVDPIEIEAAEKIDLLLGILRAARKHVDPVIQYRLMDAIDKELKTESPAASTGPPGAP